MAAPPKRRSSSLGALGRLRADKVAMLGAVLVVVVLTAAIFGPLTPLPDPNFIERANRLSPPSAAHLLGNDELGRDLLSRVIWGARVSIPLSLAAMTLSVIAGVAIGLLAGYFRGPLDLVTMRIIDALLAFPGILLAVALLAVFGQDLTILVIALAIARAPDIARLTRGMAMTIGNEMYIESARAIGAGSARIMLRHVLPNSLAPILVAATNSLGLFILAEASLSFLGVGIQPPTPSWGTMLSTGKVYMEVSPWVTLWPGLAIFITVLGFNLLGDGIRDATDPRLRAR